MRWESSQCLQLLIHLSTARSEFLSNNLGGWVPERKTLEGEREGPGRFCNGPRRDLGTLHGRNEAVEHDGMQEARRTLCYGPFTLCSCLINLTRKQYAGAQPCCVSRRKAVSLMGFRSFCQMSNLEKVLPDQKSLQSI